MPTSITKFVKVFKRSKKPKPKEKRKDGVVSQDECIVCLETEQCVSTQKCNHPICVKCLGTYIAVTHGSRMPCSCPSSAICKAVFTIEDIAPFVDDEQIAKIWLEQAALQIEKGLGIYCPNPQCSKPILWNAKAKKRRGAAGKCRGCSQPVCVPCKSAYHFNMTCSQYKAIPDSERSAIDLQLFDLARQNRWVRCPGCHAMVQRLTGCFYMSCRCGTRFCYECGAKLTTAMHICSVGVRQHTVY